jgi:2-polyprenyl-3-methyl-5-hydroxy-6-metoxy-1,4-benzoquinol methylase
LYNTVPEGYEFLKTVFLLFQVTSVLELGAGTGQYSKVIRSSGFFTSCYDGNPNTQELSEGRCGVIDLSKSTSLTKHDWVLCLEVGEHIPQEFEEAFIRNLDSANKYGIILSWAIEGQNGWSHVNTRNNSYVHAKMKLKGYSVDVETEKFLRTKASYVWFKTSIMAFRKEIVTD